jgi:hypothetical protein
MIKSEPKLSLQEQWFNKENNQDDHYFSCIVPKNKNKKIFYQGKSQVPMNSATTKQ